jgi:drug/metabolite transporter (DMT)-like permease
MVKAKSAFAPGVIALVVLAAWFGLTAVFARYLAGNNGLFEQWYLRLGIGAVAALLLFRKHISFRSFATLGKKEWGLLWLRAVVQGVLAVSLYTLAAQQAKIGPVAFMQAVPSLTIFGVLLFHERLTLKKLLLVLLSFFGVVLVAVTNPRDLLSFNGGELLSLVSGVCFSFGFLSRKWHSHHLNNQEITFAMLALSAAANYVLSVVLYHRVFADASQWSSQFTIILVFAGIISVASVFLQNYGFEHVSGVVGGTILNLEQVFGPVFGYIFYQEGLSWRELIGGAVIVAAAVAMNLLDNKPSGPAPAD